MTERILPGLAASPGLAAGPAHVLDPLGVDLLEPLPEHDRAGEAERALSALSAAGEQIRALAAELAAGGGSAEAEIVETGALMAADPGLAEAVGDAVRAQGLPAAAAILAATAQYADALAAIDDPVLRLRADDVRSLGRRAARLVPGANGRAGSAPAGDVVLVASDLGPADVAELGPSVRGVALAAGGVMAHAAIVARSLGIPMVVGVGDDLLAVGDGVPVVVDGGDGAVVLAPGRDRRRRAHVAAARRLRLRERSAEARALPAETADGHRIRVLVNVASATEVGVGLGAGAEGVGLFRTELRFLDAAAWPTEDDHRRQLAPVLGCLSGKTATVRLLDFGGDKTPRFLDGTRERGIGLLLVHPAALDAQLRAIADVGSDAELRLLLPMVESAAEVEAVRSRIAAYPAAEGIQLGAMIESREAVERLDEIALAADFLSIGTNDLTHSVLGTDRFAPGDAVAYHPLVLDAIARTVAAADREAKLVEICGEAASDPIAMPLLLALGVAELSVGAARVGTVRAWARSLRFADVSELVRTALELRGPAEVAELLAPTARLLAELDDAAGEGVESRAGVVANGGQR
ncbi:MAG: aldolase/citrate lyase family protein [Thermoleophilaceae bacterium]